MWLLVAQPQFQFRRIQHLLAYSLFFRFQSFSGWFSRGSHFHLRRMSLAADSMFFVLSISINVQMNQQGGAEHSGDCTQRSYPLVLEAESDQLCVPAFFTFGYGQRLSQEPHQDFSFSQNWVTSTRSCCCFQGFSSQQIALTIHF